MDLTRRPEALRIQAVGNLATRFSLAAQVRQALLQAFIVPQLVVVGDRPANLVVADEAPGPMDRHGDALCLPFDVYHDALNQASDDRLPIRRGSPRVRP